MVWIFTKTFNFLENSIVGKVKNFSCVFLSLVFEVFKSESSICKEIKRLRKSKSYFKHILYSSCWELDSSELRKTDSCNNFSKSELFEFIFILA